MKKLLLSFSVIFTLLLTANSAYATSTIAPTNVSSTGSVTPTKSQETIKEKLDEQINELKEKIASRVSELKLVEKRGIIGTVTDVSTTKITLTDVSGKTRFVDVDEITKFSSSSKTSFGLSDLTKGTKISVLGLYNKQSKRILARFISAFVAPTSFTGAISNIDKEEFTVTVITEEQKSTTFDIENTTKISVYNEGELSKYGFSKLEPGDRVSIIGFPNKKDTKVFVATRVIIYPDLPKNPRIVVAQPTAANEEDVTPSTGSGKKLTPLKR